MKRKHTSKKIQLNRRTKKSKRSARSVPKSRNDGASTYAKALSYLIKTEEDETQLMVASSGSLAGN